MNRFYMIMAVSLVFLGVASGRGKGKDDATRVLPILTHADASVILAKYAGFFDRYVAPDASVNDCVTFLNRTGVYFGLLEVTNGAEFTRADFACSMGQISLVLGGEAEFEGGKVKLPNDIATWEDFCTMNGIEFAEAYQSMLDSFYSLVGNRGE